MGIRDEEIESKNWQKIKNETLKKVGHTSLVLQMYSSVMNSLYK